MSMCTGGGDEIRRTGNGSCRTKIEATALVFFGSMGRDYEAMDGG